MMKGQNRMVRAHAGIQKGWQGGKLPILPGTTFKIVDERIQPRVCEIGSLCLVVLIKTFAIRVTFCIKPDSQFRSHHALPQ